MENNESYRVRVNTKQTAKGEYYLDITTEINNTVLPKSDILAKKHLEYIQNIEAVMKVAGKKLVEVK